MKISGFSFCRNAHTLFYPFLESIKSALPVCDEFVVAVGKGDDTDTTREQILALNSEKIVVIDTEWDITTFRGGTEYARQTDIAKSACSGDWLLYLQADEVLHEDDLPIVKSRCEKYLHDTRVEGMIFNYLHFWGDYDHYHTSHGWYPREIRMVRNNSDIHSWVDAQSFRRIPNFDGKSYSKLEGAHLLNVVHSNARVFHYGWVRPPDFMQRKKRNMETQYHGNSSATEELFHYGNLDSIPVYIGTHPAVMDKRIANIDWLDTIYTMQHHAPTRAPFKHEKPLYKIVSWIEQKVLGGRHVGAYKNYKLIK